MEKKHTLFSNQDLKRLIVPLIFEQALAITVGMADTIMISNAGEAAVSGVSLVDMFNNLIISVFAALATGGAVVTSQLLGAKKKDEACRSIMQLIVSSLFLTAVLTAFCIIARHGIVSVFFGSIEKDVFDNATLYLLISALSFPFLSVYNSCAAIFRSMNDSKTTLKVSMVMNLINVVGNFIGVFILNAGVVGVAVPSLISRAFAGITLFILLQNRSLELHILKEKFKINFKTIRRIFYIGIPSGIENGIFQLGRVIVVSIISGFGTVQIAANGVANSLDAMGIIGGQAMNLAMITVIGRCVGAGKADEVRYYTKKLMLITYGLNTMFNGVLLIGLHWILKLYGLSYEATHLAFILVAIHSSFAMLLWPMSFTFPNMLRACNDVTYTMGISIFSMFVFRIGLSLIIAKMFGLGAIGVWIAMVVDWVFRVSLFVARYVSKKWIVMGHME